MLKIFIAETDEDLEQVRELFIEFSEFLGEVFSGYANQPWFGPHWKYLAEEADSLPGNYAGPEGFLLLAEHKGQPAGCIALTRLSDGVSELKRLYVKPGFRRMGIGRSLVKAVIAKGRQAGYYRIRLSTNSLFSEAICLYNSCGFEVISHYEELPESIKEIIVSMELKLV